MTVENLLGSADFTESYGYEQHYVFNGQNILFGRSAYEKGLYWGAPPTQHFVTIAPTRSGKGAALIIPNLIIYDGSVIVIDPKGENAYITAERRRQMGQKTHILDPWGEVNRRYGSKTKIMEEVARFNPLSILDPKSEHFADDVAYIADALIINQGNDPHWQDSARELVAGLIAFTVYKSGSKAHLPLVRLLLTKGPAGIAKVAHEATEFGSYNLAAKKLRRFIDPQNKELQSIISTALTQLSFLDSVTLSKNLMETSFSFEDLIKEKSTIYLVLPVDKLQTYGRWLRLMVSLGIRTIARNAKNIEQPILFILDEFGTIGKLSAISQAVGLMAGMKMCIWAFVQDLNQLKHDYNDQWETFVSNSHSLTCFNVMDQFTAEYISKMMGITTVVRRSQSSANQAKQNKSFAGLMSDQVFSKPLQHPDEIRRTLPFLGIGIGRENPYYFGKMFYYENECFFKHCRQDPNFQPPVAKEPIFLPKPVDEKNTGCLKIGGVVLLCIFLLSLFFRACTN